MTQEERWHPIFGRLTDPEDIMVFDRLQAEKEYDKAMQKAMEDEYNKAMEKAMEDEYNRQCEMEERLFDRLIPIIKELEATKACLTAEELAETGNCSVEEAKHVMKTLNL